MASLRRRVATGLVALLAAGVLAGAPLAASATADETLRDGEAAATSEAADGEAGGSSSGDASSEGDAVAARVGDVCVYEQDVSDYVASFRAHYDLADDETWAEYLGTVGYTPEMMRDLTIEQLMTVALIEARAAELGVAPTDDQVEAQVALVREAYGLTDDDAWAEYLAQYGVGEDDYVDQVRATLAEQALCEAEVPYEVVTDDDVLAAWATAYLGGTTSKRFSSIYADGFADATGMLYTFTEGVDVAAHFAELATERSTDEQSAAQGGDIGWDVQLNLASSEYAETVLALEPGELLTEVLPTSTGWQLIMCTEEYAFPETVTADDLAEMPEGLLEYVTDECTQAVWQRSCSDYIAALYADADVEVAEMPEGLPYDVEPVVPSSASQGADGSAASE